MTIENLEIRTNPFKKTPARKKDGLHQIKIRVFIGQLQYGRFNIYKRLEIKVLDDADKPLMMSASDYDNIKKNKPQQYHVIKAELIIPMAVKQMILDKVELTSKLLYEYVYLKRSEDNRQHDIKEDEIWNDEIKKWFRYPIPESIWENFVLEVKADQRESITEVEISNIADGLLAEDSTTKERKRIQLMDYNTRYEQGYFDKHNIFECCGFCRCILLLEQGKFF